MSFASSRPYPYEGRLKDLFREIEGEFERLYEENLELRRRLAENKIPVPPPTYPAVTSSFFSTAGPSAKEGKASGAKSSVTAKIKASKLKLVSAIKDLTDVDKGEWVVSRPFIGHRDGVWEVSSCSWDRLVGSASVDRTARLWNFDDAQTLLVYTGHKGSVNSVRFHDCQRIVVTSSGDRTVHLWRVPDTGGGAISRQDRPISLKSATPHIATKLEGTGERESRVPSPLLESVHGTFAEAEPITISTPLLTLEKHTDVCTVGEWTSGGEGVASGGWDGNVFLWDVESGALERSLVGHEGAIMDIRALYQEMVSVSADHTMIVWDVRTASPSAVVSAHSDTARSAVFAGGGDYIVSGGDDRLIKVWDRRNFRVPTNTIHTTAGMNRMAVAPPKNTEFAVPFDNCQVRIYDLAGNRLGIMRGNGHTRMICSCAWSMDGDAVLTSSFDRKVFAWRRSDLSMVDGCETPRDPPPVRDDLK